MDSPARSRPVQTAGPLTAEAVAQRDEYEAELQGLIDLAEDQLQGRAVNVPDTIYSGLQEAGYFSADPVIDSDPEIAAKAQSLMQLVKEFSVSPSGRWELAAVQREIDAIGEGEWCVNCFSPQRFTDDEWESRMQKLETVIGPRPEGSDKKCRCPVCGAGLGYQGMVQAETLTGPESFTPEQQDLVHEFFQGIFTASGKPKGYWDADSQ
jgi:hypothetical protein